jgi:brefeldin A-inhibited guanine nucleotide-exchange protein
VSLLKNCTSDDTRVVNLSLRVFVPIIRNFRSLLKTEIEAFVTNVFFVILDSKNSPIEHKNLVVTLFEEICSDPTTLAEIFLNYDCDLSAVDLFHRIVNTLSKVARSMELPEDNSSTSTISLVAGAGAVRMEKMRSDHRELRLAAMRALRQVLASLHASIVEPMVRSTLEEDDHEEKEDETNKKVNTKSEDNSEATPSSSEPEKQSLVQIYDSKKKRREEESEATLRFNQKPAAGITYAAKCGHVDGSDATDVALFLLKNKDRFEKTQIGEYLGREPDYQKGFSLRVLHEYVNSMDFAGLMFDDAIRFYLSGFRLPGEAQKVRQKICFLQFLMF